MKYGFIKHVKTGALLNFYHNGNIYAESNLYEATILAEEDAKFRIDTKRGFAHVIFGADEEKFRSENLKNDEFIFAPCEINLVD